MKLPLFSPLLVCLSLLLDSTSVDCTGKGILHVRAMVETRRSQGTVLTDSRQLQLYVISLFENMDVSLAVGKPTLT